MPKKNEVDLFLLKITRQKYLEIQKSLNSQFITDKFLDWLEDFIKCAETGKEYE